MSDPNEHQNKPSEKPGTKAPEEDFQPMSEDELIAGLDGISDAAINTDEISGFANPLEALAAENSRQEDEIKELNDKLLRSAAEMENLRRRTQKDVADARAYSISGFARDLLGVSDNLRRALDHIPAEAREQPDLKTLAEGVELTERELLNSLEKNGVKKLDPKGVKFDPNFHQAMFEVQNPDVPNNSVTEVIQVGFVIGDRVLRPAMVGVAKGGPKTSPTTPAEPENPDTE